MILQNFSINPILCFINKSIKISLNKEIFVNYNTKNTLYFNFTQWMLKTLPKNVRDKKKRFYKP